MALIQKFILYLEQPIYSYSVILASILLFARIGSLLSKNIDRKNKYNFLKIILAVFFIVFLYVIFLKPIINSTISLPLSNKIVITGLISIPISLLMGMLLPLGIKRLNIYNLDVLIPWCWSANGATSVLTSILAVLIAIIAGFNFVLMLGGFMYIVAFLFILNTQDNI